MTQKLTTRRPTIFELSPVERIMTNFLSRDPFFSGALAEQEGEGSLALDISEDEKSVYVRASLPGFKKEDVSVEVHDNVLTIAATHQEETEEKTERFHRRERRIGSLSRRVTLPAAVADDNAKAELKDGVLTLQFAKSPKDMPRKISVS